MIQLFVDVGNSALKAWRVQGDQVLIRYAAQRHGGQPVPLILALLAGAGIGEVVLASVLGEAVAEELGRALVPAGVALRELKSVAQVAGVLNGYREPERLGVDRWLAVLAVAKPGRPVCVVDCGTATTIDIVDDAGNHVGGYILPGLALMAASLRRGTVAAQGDDRVSGGIVPGRNTRDAIGHGAVLATVGAIECASLVAGDKSSRHIMLTGGAGTLLLPHFQRPVSYEPDLVLAGMLRYVSATDGIG